MKNQTHKKKRHQVVTNDNMTRLNRIKPATNVIFNLIFALLALICILPIFYIFLISITRENVIRTQGYQFFVTADTVSAEAYKYLWTQRATILNSLWISVEVTAVGTVLGVALTNVQNGYNLIQSIFAGFGTAVGYTVAIVLLAAVREHLDEDAIPAPFRGAPIVLLCAALMAMAFVGFSGLA